MKGVSGQCMRYIQALYAIEEKLRAAQASALEIKSTRQSESRPILAEFKSYLDEKANTVLPKSPVGVGVDYTLKRWAYLTTYIADGRYEIDNNRAERAIKPFVVGRKNWLFSNTPKGAHSSARLFTLIETAKANGQTPELYLNHIFKKLPFCSRVEDYEALLPWNLKAETVS